MAARIRRIEHSDEVRARIQTSQLINRLRDHVFGKVELTPAQVQSARILLGKTLPDLSAIEHSGQVTNRVVSEYSNDELKAIIAASSAGTAKTAGSPGEPAQVH